MGCHKQPIHDVHHERLDPSQVVSTIEILDLPSCASVGVESNAPPLPEEMACIKQVKPVYPPIALSFGISGSIEIRLLVRPDGVVDSAKVLHADMSTTRAGYSMSPILNEASLQAAVAWRYSPAHGQYDPSTRFCHRFLFHYLIVKDAPPCAYDPEER
jgi:TonB family protein